MESYLPIADDVYWIGVNDRETALFEGLWPLPRGVSYNSYLIVDEKVAVVDTVKAMKSDQYVANLRALVPEGKKVDYLIVNHMEPDHSGSISLLRGRCSSISPPWCIGLRPWSPTRPLASCCSAAMRLAASGR
jgi:flavorubredoxin